MVADFMVAARAILAGGISTERLTQVGELLARASQEPGFVTEPEMRSLHHGQSTFTLLQTDPDGLTLMLARFSPDEETPVHNHHSWGVACVVRGQDRYRHWQGGTDGRVELLYEKVLERGAFVTWLDLRTTSTASRASAKRRWRSFFLARTWPRFHAITSTRTRAR